MQRHGATSRASPSSTPGRLAGSMSASTAGCTAASAWCRPNVSPSRPPCSAPCRAGASTPPMSRPVGCTWPFPRSSGGACATRCRRVVSANASRCARRSDPTPSRSAGPAELVGSTPGCLLGAPEVWDAVHFAGHPGRCALGAPGPPPGPGRCPTSHRSRSDPPRHRRRRRGGGPRPLAL